MATLDAFSILLSTVAIVLSLYDEFRGIRYAKNVLANSKHAIQPVPCQPKYAQGFWTNAKSNGYDEQHGAVDVTKARQCSLKQSRCQPFKHSKWIIEQRSNASGPASPAQLVGQHANERGATRYAITVSFQRPNDANTIVANDDGYAAAQTAIK